jgi:hypothetical protein
MISARHEEALRVLELRERAANPQGDSADKMIAGVNMR